MVCIKKFLSISLLCSIIGGSLLGMDIEGISTEPPFATGKLSILDQSKITYPSNGKFYCVSNIKNFNKMLGYTIKLNIPLVPCMIKNLGIKKNNTLGVPDDTGSWPSSDIFCIKNTFYLPLSLFRDAVENNNNIMKIDLFDLRCKFDVVPYYNTSDENHIVLARLKGQFVREPNFRLGSEKILIEKGIIVEKIDGNRVNHEHGPNGWNPKQLKN